MYTTLVIARLSDRETDMTDLRKEFIDGYREGFRVGEYHPHKLPDVINNVSPAYQRGFEAGFLRTSIICSSEAFRAENSASQPTVKCAGMN